MKIFATSDTHNDSIILNKLKDFLLENEFDEVIHCGDICGKDKNNRDLIEFSKYQEEHFKYFTDNFPNISYIFGNDDWVESRVGIFDNEKHISLDGIFIGFELVHITPFSTNREANENKIWYELNQLPIRQNKIIIAHSPPYNCLDMTYRGENVGSKSIRRIIEEKQPKLWLCGHIHESFGVKTIINTAVFNCACSPEKHLLRGWIIDTETLDYEKVII